MKMKWKRFLVKLRNAHDNPANARDFGLGIFVNAVYSIMNNGFTLVNFLLVAGSFYVIIEANYKLQKRIENG